MQSLAQRRLSSLQAAHGDMPLLDLLLMVSLILQIGLFTNNLRFTHLSSLNQGRIRPRDLGSKKTVAFCPSSSSIPAPHLTLNSPMGISR